jgi:two-component system, NarL family, sensor kinase
MITHLKIALLAAPSALLIIFMAIAIIYLVLYFNKRFMLMQQKLQLLENEKQSEISRVIEKTRQEERNKIASNLHDGVGAELSLLKLKLTKYSFYLKNNQRIKSNRFIKDINQLDDTIQHVRSVCKDLYAETIDSIGFIKSCEEFVNQINSVNSIKSRFNTNLIESELPISVEHKKTTFMMFQEMMNNLLKHSACNNLEVNLEVTNNKQIKLSCRHNGVKFNNEDMADMITLGKGIGLNCMNKRAELMGAHVNYQYQNQTSSVEILIPYTNSISANAPLSKFKSTRKKLTVN